MDALQSVMLCRLKNHHIPNKTVESRACVNKHKQKHYNRYYIWEFTSSVFGVIYLSLSFWWKFRDSFCLSIDDRFQGPFLKLKHRINTKYIQHMFHKDKPKHTQYDEFLLLTFSLFSWSCNMTLIFRRVSSSFFNSCRRLCIFTGTAAVRPFLNTDMEEIRWSLQ